MTREIAGIYEPSPNTQAAVRQGEILCGLHQYVRNLESLSQQDAVLDTITHPVAVVATQDCDLDIDFKERQSTPPSPGRIIPSVLFCYVVSVEDLRQQPGVNRVVFRSIESYTHERYYHLDEVPADQDALRQGLPPAIIDFKKYFTIPTDELYYQISDNATRRCRLLSPFLEHFATRFRNYQSRVALPDTDG